MKKPRIMLATLALNEIEWLEKSFVQHEAWPGVDDWVFVEAADRAYASANPSLVSSSGLSVDGTTEWLEYNRGVGAEVTIHHLPIGFVGDGGAQGKMEARNRYLELADGLNPDWLIVIDADEFYSREDQKRITEILTALSHEPRPPAIFRQRHIWRPESISGETLCGREVVGGYWEIPHVRVWPWYKGLRHVENHNWIQGTGKNGKIRLRAIRMDQDPTAPQCVHMAFASSREGRAAKHTYYQNRGEGVTDHRRMYVECRSSWETWNPGDELPHGASVVPYQGPVPEVFG